MKAGPRCVECRGRGRLKSGAEVYPRRPDLAGKWFWVCECGAKVGCHGGGTTPLGYCAGPETQAARRQAHATFDPIWRARKPKRGARSAGYAWLSKELGIPPESCHIGMIIKDQAERVVALCAPVLAKINARRNAGAVERIKEPGIDYNPETPPWN